MTPSAPVEPAPSFVPSGAPVAPASGPAIDGRRIDLYLDRDASWLHFNERVLHEAVDARNPLLERVRFSGIFRSNLDEFFMKRIGLLSRLARSTPERATHDGLLPTQQVQTVRELVHKLLRQQAACFHELLRPALKEQKIELCEWDELSAAERAEADAYFRRNVFPILTPLAVDPGHPFPFISNLSLSLAVVLQHPDRSENVFARLKIPETLPSWLRLSTPGVARFLSLYDLIRNNLAALFSEMKIVDVMVFRITRSVEAETISDEDAEDLLEAVQQELRQRRFAPVVRLEHEAGHNPQLLELLVDELDLDPTMIYEAPLALKFGDLSPIIDLKIPALSFAPWSPTIPKPLQDEDADFFSIIRGGDLLLHHPYESFAASVERFITSAAADPKVVAIKMTLYRTGDDSPFVRTLIRAAEAGKQVVCLVELKARFDEQRNIMLTRALEKAGVHVVYGIVGLKTHCKVALVVRQDTDGLRSYVHIGTGNYHTQTARLYTDLGLFTADGDICEDVVELFHHLTGRSIKRDYRKLLVAPETMRQSFLSRIDREMSFARERKPAHIIAKMNSLQDPKIIDRLVEASQAGVRVDLIVRGLCCIRPGVPGYTDNVFVRSIIGRFLEHSRIFYFRNGQDDPINGEFLIGSNDWMSRNLSGRVEVVTPISARPHRERIYEILTTMLTDTRQAWEMDAGGAYTQLTPIDNNPGTHQRLMELTKSR